MKISHLIISVVIIFIVVFGFIYREKSNHKKNIQNIENEIKSYIDSTYKIERDFIENIPVFHDYVTKAKENALRTYLIEKHRKAIQKIAMKLGLNPFRNSNDIKEAIALQKIVSLEPFDDKLYYFHNVKKAYRYATKMTKIGLEMVTSRFQENMRKRKNGLPNVKLAISSVIRPVDYQKELFNVAFVSTHSYGTTFDIFFDDYFVFLPKPKKINRVSENIRKKLHKRLGFLMGDALRRQFQSILMETLIQLQNEGRLYAIFEKRNRCYHVTILN